MKRSPAGSVSPRAIPDCAGLDPWFVSVKMSVVVAPSAIVAAPKVLAAFGAVAVTETHWFAEVLVAFVVVTLAARFVNAATGHVPACPGSLVRPESVTVQLAVPEVMARPVTPLSTRVATV